MARQPGQHGTPARSAWHAGPVSETRPAAAPPAHGAVPPALVAEATKRAGLIWITVPGAARPRAAWHAWQDGAAYVLTGPGEQAVPGLDAAREAVVTVPSKDTGGQLLTWTAAVTRVDPDSPGWAGVIGALLAGRLNPAREPGGESPALRWARTGQVYRLSPSESSATEGTRLLAPDGLFDWRRPG